VQRYTLIMDKNLSIVPYNPYGAGGLFGKPKSSKNTVIPDSGRSISKGHVIEILASGGDYGIEGLGSNPKENIYLDDTPIVANGIENFKGIEIIERRGLPFQLPLQDFNNEIVSEVAVGVTVTHNNPVTRTVVNENTAAIRLRLSFVLSENTLDKDGNVTGTKGTGLQFKVFIKEGTGNFVEVCNVTQDGKYSEPYEKIWFFTVNTEVDEYSIRVERVTGADNDNFRRILRWESHSVVIDTVLSFKRLAYSALRFNAEDFGQSIPTRRYKLKGQILRVPTNSEIDVTDRGLNYTGNWDGNFKIPTIMTRSFLPIVWFLMTDEIDGCGIAPQNINRWSLQQVDKYNNEFIKVIVGGVEVSERRYLFDMVFNRENTSPYELINWLCSGCNCRIVEEYGQITFVQDRPTPIYATLTNSDVEEGKFIYSSVDVTEVATQVQVTWTDQSIGKTRPELLNDPSLIAKYGKLTKQIEAVGCSRRSQAIRIGRAVLFSEGNELETVTFKSRDFAAYIPVGSVIAIQDSNINGLVFGGNCATLHTQTPISITFNNPITLQSFDTSKFNEEYYLVLYPDAREAIRVGTYQNGLEHYQQVGQSEGRFFNGYLLHISDSQGVNHVRRITNNLPGTYSTLTVTPPLPFTPQENTPFMVQVPSLPLKLFKIESKQYDIDMVTLTGKQYIDTKWDYIENQYSIEASNVIPVAIQRPLPPNNLDGDYFLTETGFNIEITWSIPVTANGDRDNNIARYYVYFAADSDTWSIRETESNSFSLVRNTFGVYQFKVVAENINSQLSDDSTVLTINVDDIQASGDVGVGNNSMILVII
jgi:predicted phage tail protein